MLAVSMDLQEEFKVQDHVQYWRMVFYHHLYGVQTGNNIVLLKRTPRWPFFLTHQIFFPSTFIQQRFRVWWPSRLDWFHSMLCWQILQTLRWQGWGWIFIIIKMKRWIESLRNLWDFFGHIFFCIPPRLKMMMVLWFWTIYFLCSISEIWNAYGHVKDFSC